MIAPAVAVADEIPKIALTQAGPDAPIPVGSSFYLAGTGDANTTSAQVFVIRKGSRSLARSAGPSCAEIKRQLHAEAPGKTTVPAGVHVVREAYPAASDELKESALLASAQWQRGTLTGNQDYKLLVAADPVFYTAGYSYCLFVETAHHSVDHDAKTLAGYTQKLVDNIVNCTTVADDQRAACEARQLTAYEASINDYAGKLAAAASERTPPAELQKRKTDQARKLLAQARAAVEAAVNLKQAQLELANLANTPDVIAQPDLVNYGDVAQPLEAAPGDPPPKPAEAVAIQRGHFARAIALLLSWNQGLLFYPPAGRRGFYAGTLRIGELKLDANGQTIDVAATAAGKPADTRKLDTTTAKLEVAPGVSVYDLVLLTRGRIIVNGTDWRLSDLGAKLRDLDRDASWSAETALANAAAARLQAIDDAFTALTVAGAALLSTNDDATRTAALAHLQAWQASLQLSTHLEKQRMAYQAIDRLLEAKQQWDASKADLDVVTKEIIAFEASDPIPLAVEFSEKTWVFSYLTPVLGFAEINADGGFAVPYIAVQLHLVPNPGSDVLWSHGDFGRDVWRAFAFELGFSPTINSGFGPDNRYTGRSGFAPVFGGIAFHIVPYTSITFGEALVDRRATTLVGERPQHKLEPFVGFNVQFNIPDYIREASKVDTTTKVTP